MRPLLQAVSLVVCLLVAPAAMTAPGKLKSSQSKSYRIAEVDYQGLWRTHASVLDEELVFERGETVSLAEIKKSVQRIRNTSLFRKVTYKIEEIDRGSRLVVEVDERWTLLPMFQLSQGGGTRRIIAGFSDINMFGRYLELGAQYQRLGETNSFYGWVRKPQFLGYRLAVGALGGTQNSSLFFFDDQAAANNGFSLTRNLAEVFVDKEWTWWLYSQLTLRYGRESFSLQYIGDDDVEDRQRDVGLPEKQEILTPSLSLQLGRIDEHNYRFDGKSISASWTGATDAVVSDKGFQTVQSTVSYYELLPWKGNLATQFGAGYTTADSPHRLFFLGGLDSVRGFQYNQFAGDSYWLFNAEYRIASIDNPYVVLQHTAFVDAGGIGALPEEARAPGLSSNNFWGLKAASTGVGVRLIVPKVRTFIVRFDYALPLHGAAVRPTSFGAGQFF